MNSYLFLHFTRTIIYPSKISPKATPNPAWFFVTCFIATISHTFIQVHYLANLHQPTDPSIVTIIGKKHTKNSAKFVKFEK
jgi:hypothetical protein